MMIFFVVGIVFFLIIFIIMKEWVVLVLEMILSIKEDIIDLMGNWFWLIIFCVIILVFIMFVLKGGMYIYYFENYLSVVYIWVFFNDI